MTTDTSVLPPDKTVALRCGTLRLWIEHSEMDFEALCGFASRRSRKRGFVFVSKVLGKHYPVRPRLMAQVHARLASSLIDMPGPAIVIALAETATGLGQGIFENWLWRSGRSDILFLHSTRYCLRRPVAFGFEESHSHAAQHMIYEPADPAQARLFSMARALVLVDDEMTTGRTLINLIKNYRRLNPDLASVHIISLTDWLGSARRAEIEAEIGLSVSFHSLLRGWFELIQDDAFDPGPIPDVTGRSDIQEMGFLANYGRLGVGELLDLDLDNRIRAIGVQRGDRLLVLGTGEFAYPPFLMAQRLEEHGWDVHFQSTTRSPLLLDRDISSVLEFPDNYGEGMPNYVYNVADRRYDRIVIGLETMRRAEADFLTKVIGGVPIFF